MTTLLLTVIVLILSVTVPGVDQVDPERMRADLEFLASPPLEGRASLTRGSETAAWFIASEMRKIGLRPGAGTGYLQPFDVVPIKLDRERSSIRVAHGDVEQTFSPGSVFFPNPGHAVDLDVPVVFAGFGITAPELGYDDYASLNVRGKAVLLFDHEPEEGNPRSVFNGTGFTLHANAWTKTRNAQEHGAAAVILVTEPLNAHRPALRAPDRANAPPQGLAASELRIPRMTAGPEVADAILRATGRSPADWQSAIERGPSPSSKALDGVRVRLRAINAESAARPSWNAAGMLPGSDPARSAETVLITSHYDHLGLQSGTLYPGANDNASGVAAMLETARMLVRHPPAHSVLFIAFGSEEQLMLGSYHYVAHPLRPLDITRAVLNLDMIGRNEEHTPESAGAYELTAGRPDQLNLVGAVFSPDLQAVLERASADAGIRLSTKFDVVTHIGVPKEAGVHCRHIDAVETRKEDNMGFTSPAR